MEVLKLADVQKMIELMTDIIIENEVPFCELDSVAGDGDFGMSLAKGFKMLKDEWENVDKEDIGIMLKECSLTIFEHCGGASGPIWGSAFSGAARGANGKVELNLSEYKDMFFSAIESIQKRGGAKQGDKTLLDALIPAAQSLEKSLEVGVGLQAALLDSAKAAVQGAEETKNMIASRGRASYVGERSLQYPDAGAQAIGIILTGVYDKLFNIA